MDDRRYSADRKIAMPTRHLEERLARAAARNPRLHTNEKLIVCQRRRQRPAKELAKGYDSLAAQRAQMEPSVKCRETRGKLRRRISVRDRAPNGAPIPNLGVTHVTDRLNDKRHAFTDERRCLKFRLAD
jgi:hypothetical protein